MEKFSDRLRRPSAKPAAVAAPTAQFQLPLLPDHMRALSNPIARSALFTIGNRKRPRRFVKQHIIASLNGIHIKYTGEELFQDDHDVFMQVCHLARMHPLGTSMTFTAYSMMQRLRWSKNADSYERLANTLDRLNASSLHLTFTLANNVRANYTGSLIRSFKWREDSTGESMRQWEVLLEKEIVALFPETGYSAIDWDTHLKLRPMAKWLHNFYSTHQYAFAYSVERMQKLMQSEAKTRKQFKLNLKEALDQLVKVGFLAWFTVTSDDMVQVIRVGFEDPDRAHFSFAIEAAEAAEPAQEERADSAV